MGDGACSLQIPAEVSTPKERRSGGSSVKTSTRRCSKEEPSEFLTVFECLPLTSEAIAKASKRSLTLYRVAEFTMNGRPSDCADDLKPYYVSELSLEQGCVTLGFESHYSRVPARSSAKLVTRRAPRGQPHENARKKFRLVARNGEAGPGY